MPYKDPAAYRAWHKQYMRGKERSLPPEKRANMRPFVGVDGEGAGGVDWNDLTFTPFSSGDNESRAQRQHYKLLRAGEHLLFDNNRPLTAEDCLGFLTGLPDGVLYVGFFFGYDASMILRDLPEEKLQYIGGQTWTFWQDYAIKYVPKQSFSVGIIDRKTNKIKKGSVRTIFEVGAFFQCSFVKALTQWKITDADTLEQIQAGKDARGTLDEIDEETIYYNKLEVELLAELMTRFRAACVEANCVPNRWQGPGWIASTLLTRYDAPKRKDVLELIPEEIRLAADAAFFGGRFEVTQIGSIPGPIYEYDINSAYPAAMLKLPCLRHAQFVPFGKDEPLHATSLAFVAYSHRVGARLCGLPIRDKQGHLFFPRAGTGWYWGNELLCARASLGTAYEVMRGWHIQTQCDCKPFAWIEELYEFRKSLGKSDKGIALKLGMNSVYGKQLQRIGSQPFMNEIYAGLITSFTRAMLLQAIGAQEDAVIMLATDGVYSRVPLVNPCLSSGLGNWESHQFDSIFIAQPGLYHAHDSAALNDSDEWKRKTRGISLNLMLKDIGGETHFQRLEKQWQRYMQTRNPKHLQYPLTFDVFIGYKLAMQRNKLHLAGSWVSTLRRLNMAWWHKRDASAEFCDGYIKTVARTTDQSLTSHVYSGVTPDAIAEARELMSEMPDYCEIGPARV